MTPSLVVVTYIMEAIRFLVDLDLACIVGTKKYRTRPNRKKLGELPQAASLGDVMGKQRCH